jgi:hypothetical protein
MKARISGVEPAFSSFTDERNQAPREKFRSGKGEA